MAFSEETKRVIKFFRHNKHFGAKRFLKEFPYKSWSRSGLDKIIRKIDRTGTLKRLPAVAVCALLELHRTQRRISWEVSISQHSVNCIVNKELCLICMKKLRAHDRGQQRSST